MMYEWWAGKYLKTAAMVSFKELPLFCSGTDVSPAEFRTGYLPDTSILH
jgi:hypothetical protein